MVGLLRGAPRLPSRPPGLHPAAGEVATKHAGSDVTEQTSDVTKQDGQTFNRGPAAERGVPSGGRRLCGRVSNYEIVLI